MYNNSKFLHLSISFWLKYICSIIVISLFSSNIILTFLALLILPICIKLVWRRNEPPVFILIIGFHWLQITVKIFHADFRGVDLQYISFCNATDIAIYLSLIGLLSLSLGIHFFLKRIPIISKEYLLNSLSKYSINKIILIYFIFIFIDLIFTFLSNNIPSLSAILYTAKNFKILFMYLLFVVCFFNKKYYIIFFILIMETAIGFSGFFSSFKTVYFILILSFFTINPKINFSKILKILPIIIFLFTLVVMWTAIKQDYRHIVSNNQKDQKVNISFEKQLNTYIHLLSNLNENKVLFALEQFAYRLEYIEFFAQTIKYVPNNIDYEYGTLWFNAYTNFLQPRFFFPEKEKLDDSQRTTKYTGVWHPDGKDGVSISLGYFTESYIDFGPYFMFIPIFILGLLYGYISKLLLKIKYHNILFSYSAIILILHSNYLFETRNDKIIGGFIIILILFFLSKKILLKIFNFMEKK